MSVTRYHWLLVALHWVLAFFIIVSLYMGTMVLEDMPNSDPAKIDALRGHMIGGVVILALMVVRLLVRMMTAHPPAAPTGMALADAIAPWTHRALYLLVFVMVISGFATSLMAGLPDIVFGGSGQPLPADFFQFWPRIVHGITAGLLMALVALHIAAAIYHQFVKGDGLFRRMWFGRRT
jgi:cytochrome b561